MNFNNKCTDSLKKLRADHLIRGNDWLNCLKTVKMWKWISAILGVVLVIVLILCCISMTIGGFSTFGTGLFALKRKESFDNNDYNDYNDHNDNNEHNE